MTSKTTVALIVTAFIATFASPAFARPYRGSLPSPTNAYGFAPEERDGPWNAYGTHSVDPPNPSGGIPGA
jgi:glucose dehydrogenase